MTEGKRRATPDDVRRRRLANQFVLPVGKKIGRWQVIAARLSGLASRSDSLLRPDYVKEVEALEASVAAEHKQLLAELSELAPEMRRQGRIVDTLRALASLTTAVQAIQRRLGKAAVPVSARSASQS